LFNRICIHYARYIMHVNILLILLWGTKPT
jgi:hypothetical protein